MNKGFRRTVSTASWRKRDRESESRSRLRSVVSRRVLAFNNLRGTAEKKASAVRRAWHIALKVVT
jgi:hypothetical protein